MKTMKAIAALAVTLLFVAVEILTHVRGGCPHGEGVANLQLHEL